MSCLKILREARKLAEREIEKYGLSLSVVVRRGTHPQLVLATPGGQRSQFVVLAGTPSCSRWQLNLRRDLRQVLRRLEAQAANDRGAPEC